MPLKCYLIFMTSTDTLLTLIDAVNLYNRVDMTLKANQDSDY